MRAPRQTIGFSGYNVLRNEYEMKREVAEKGPIACGVRVDEKFQDVSAYLTTISI